MYGPAKRNSVDNSKPRYSKLRASCDTCFLAKVKCSKTRPICSRCLACGADCNYSPSSRAGKPKSAGSKAHRPSLSADMAIAEGAVSNRHGPIRLNAEHHHTGYGMEAEEAEWTVMLGSPDGSMGRRSISSTSLPRAGDDSSGTDSSGNPALFDPTFSWTSTPQTDMSSPYMDNSLHYRSKSMNDGPVPQPSVPWYDHPDAANYSQPAPGLAPVPNVYMSNPMAKNPTCNCFNTCLHALGALHNSDAISAASPFDVILTVNQKAVETCSVMLNCPICMSRSGFSSRTMFLGTILGMIIAIYQDASKNYFGATGPGTGTGLAHQPLPLTFGSYRVASEDVRWLQMEIILRDLKKLKELFAKFQETSVKSESDEDAGMHSAVTNYLCQSLHHTTESLKSQRNYCCGHEGLA
ncbi:hypothetical protein EG329_010007 [Mollisiaceae sp. DMI_Dod_QoI]|nr:hypothetical protein EG329_010007 [Helotiales sp. DMI_Dod_QoI]